MTRCVPQNSAIAYHSLEDLEERRRDVWNVIRECPGVSAPEVFRIMRNRGYSVQENSVTPRITELVADGRIRITGKKVNRLTGRSVRTYEVVV